MSPPSWRPNWAGVLARRHDRTTHVINGGLGQICCKLKASSCQVEMWDAVLYPDAVRKTLKATGEVHLVEWQRCSGCGLSSCTFKRPVWASSRRSPVTAQRRADFQSFFLRERLRLAGSRRSHSFPIPVIGLATVNPTTSPFRMLQPSTHGCKSWWCSHRCGPIALAQCGCRCRLAACAWQTSGASCGQTLACK